MKDGRVSILLSDLIHLPFSCASNSGNVRQVSRPETPKKKDISHWRKGPTKILMYSLESLLQKRKHGKVCKGLLTSKHLEVSSSKKNFTAGHWTPSWYMKRNESEIFYALDISFFAALFAIWSDLELCLPALPPEYLDHHVDQPLYDQEGEGWKC